MVQVDAISSNTFRVTIDKGVTTTHEVHLSEDTADRLAPQGTDPRQIIEACIDFLLDHESNTSILRNFDVKDIGLYFPGYEEDVRKRLPQEGASVCNKPPRRRKH